METYVQSRSSISSKRPAYVAASYVCADTVIVASAFVGNEEVTTLGIALLFRVAST